MQYKVHLHLDISYCMFDELDSVKSEKYFLDNVVLLKYSV